MHRMGPCVLLVALTGCAPRELHVTMKADNNSGQSGFATISAVGKGITVVVETSAPDEAGEQAVHIHKGNCGEVDEIYADLLVIKELPGKPGRAGSTSPQVQRRPEYGGGDLAFEDFETGDWLINVHNAVERTLYVSCGEFSSK